MAYKGPLFTLELPMAIAIYQKHRIDRHLNAGRNMYNALAGKMYKRYKEMIKTKRYRDLKSQLSSDEEKNKTIWEQIVNIHIEYGFTKYDFQKEINEDSSLQDIVRTKKQLGICFHQTKSPIHDRFILVRNGTSYSGMILGTSFNSLDSNHYCLTKLSGNSAKTIYTELTDWLNSGNEKEHLRV